MKKQPVFIAIIISVLFLPFSAISAEYIKIAGFNIAEFGEGGYPGTRRLEYIADLLVDNGLHLIAIQEVGVKVQADSQVVRLVRIVNQKVSTGSRIMWGGLAGQSHITVLVTVIDPASGTELGEASVTGYGSGGTVFSGTTSQAIEKAAEGFVEFVTGASSKT